MSTLVLLFIVYAFVLQFSSQLPEEASKSYKLFLLLEQVFIPAFESLIDLGKRVQQMLTNANARAKAEAFYDSLLTGPTETKMSRFYKALTDVDRHLTRAEENDTMK